MGQGRRNLRGKYSQYDGLHLPNQHEVLQLFNVLFVGLAVVSDLSVIWPHSYHPITVKPPLLLIGLMQSSMALYNLTPVLFSCNMKSLQLATKAPLKERLVTFKELN